MRSPALGWLGLTLVQANQTLSFGLDPTERPGWRWRARCRRSSVKARRAAGSPISLQWDRLGSLTTSSGAAARVGHLASSV